MTTTARCLYRVHIADGFVDDCEELIHHCSKLKTVTYESFCEIWKNLNFASIYRGRTLSAEIAELSEEVINIAKQYLVANTSNFEESVAGLFLVYGLLNLQPFQGFACLRLVPDDMPALNRIELVARRERRLEVLYVLGAVLIRGPCQFHAAPREHGLESSYRKYIEGFTSLDKQGIRPKGVFYRQNEELDVIRELNNITRLYSEAKAKINGTETDRNLNYVDKSLPAELDNSLKNIINGLIEDEVFNDSERDENSHSTLVQAIKARAMKIAVNPVKHLTGVQENKHKKFASPVKSKPDITSKPGKVKSGSPRKPLTTASNPRKRALTKSKQKQIKCKRRKNNYHSNSSSEGELSIVSDDDDSVDDYDNIKSVGGPRARSLSATSSNYSDCDPITLDPPTNKIEIAGNETQIEVDLIPVVIHTDKSQMLEIEIVDHYQSKEDDSVENKVKNLQEITLTKTKLNGDSDNEIRDNSTEDEEVFKKPILLKRPEKCELKKSRLKSKFKKMGMLPVANFKDSRKRR